MTYDVTSHWIGVAELNVIAIKVSHQIPWKSKPRHFVALLRELKRVSTESECACSWRQCAHDRKKVLELTSCKSLHKVMASTWKRNDKNIHYKHTQHRAISCRKPANIYKWLINLQGLCNTLDNGVTILHSQLWREPTQHCYWSFMWMGNCFLCKGVSSSSASLTSLIQQPRLCKFACVYEKGSSTTSCFHQNSTCVSLICLFYVTFR